MPEQASVSTWDTTTIKLNYFELQLNKMQAQQRVAHMAVHFVQLTVVA